MNVNLRDLLDIAVGDPPRRVTAEAVRRQARRRAARTWAASLAVLVAVSLGAALAVAATGHRATPPTGGLRNSGPPRYYVASYWDQHARRSVLAVRARTTGTVTAVIRAPLPHASCGTEVAAAADQRFFMTCEKWAGHGRTAVLRQTRIYRFQVTRSGRIAGYTLVAGGVLKGQLAGAIAAAPNGSRIAVEVFRPDRSGQLYTNAVPEGIVVIDTRTGHHALWHSGPYQPGAVQFADAASLSFTGDGRDLVVLEGRCHRGRQLTECNGHPDMQVRAFGPASRGGSLERGRILLRQSQLMPSPSSITGAYISPDGSTVTAALAHCPRHGACTLSVARISTATGKFLQVLYRVHTGDRYHGYFERFFSSDASARYFILDAGAGSARINGWISNGRLVPLKPSDGNAVVLEVW